MEHIAGRAREASSEGVPPGRPSGTSSRASVSRRRRRTRKRRSQFLSAAHSATPHGSSHAPFWLGLTESQQNMRAQRVEAGLDFGEVRELQIPIAQHNGKHVCEGPSQQVPTASRAAFTGAWSLFSRGMRTRRAARRNGTRECASSCGETPPLNRSGRCATRGRRAKQASQRRSCQQSPSWTRRQPSSCAERTRPS